MRDAVGQYASYFSGPLNSGKWSQYAGNDKIDVDGEELIILSESDIKAVVEG